ncbi:MAG: N-glycosylase/DNA lyase [Ignisphaera sp.]
MPITMNFQRIDSVANTLNVLGIKGVGVFEDVDPQYLAIKYALKNCDEKIVSYMFYVNALLAYRLRIPGEKFWSKFAEYLVQECRNIKDFYQVIDFVRNFTSRYNNYAYEQKIRRLNRLRYCVNLTDLVNRGDLIKLAKITSECLNSSIEAKTVVFSVKMIYYVHKACGRIIALPFELPIPVDKRVAFITYTSGIIESNVDNVVSLLFRKPDIVRNAWSLVSLRSKIPPLNIDAVIWYFGRFSRFRDVNKILELVDNTLYEILGRDVIETLVNELFYILTSHKRTRWN